MKLKKNAQNILCFFLGLFFLGSAVNLIARLDGNKTDPHQQGLRVTPLVLDLGQINQGEKVTTAFEIKNETNTEYKNVKLISSCGCTITTPIPDHFSPGDSFRPNVEFYSTGKRGKTGTNLLLEYYSSQGRKETKLIELVADVKPNIYLTPTKLSFSSNDRFNSEKTIQLNSHNGVGFMIDLLSIDHFAFDCEEVFESAKDVESNSKARSIRIIFDSDRWKSNVKRMGKITDFKLRIKTNIKSEPAIEVPIEVQDTI